MNKLLSVLFILSSCTFIHKKNDYGMLATRELSEGELVLTEKTIQNEKCLKAIFFIPFGNFDVDKIDQTVNEMLSSEKKEVALGNVIQEIRVSGLPPFYFKRCVSLEGQPLIYR